MANADSTSPLKALARCFRALKPGERTREMPDEVLQFQPDLVEVLEERPPRGLRATHYFVAGLFVSLVTISAVFEIDMVVVGTGRLVTQEPPILVQPMERAIIREIKVKAGDVVTKGQVLATLDPTFTQADVASLGAQQRSLFALLRRLEAEQQGVAFVPRNPLDTDEALQALLYQQRQAQLTSRLRAYEEDIRRYEAGIRKAEDSRASLAQQVAVAKDVERMRATLLESQTGSRLQYLDAQSFRMRIEHDAQEVSNQLAELRHQIQSRAAERQSFLDEWRRQLLEELVRTRTEATKMDENLAKAARLHDLVVVTAPEDAVVLEVAKRSMGSVLREAEPLMTLVPTTSPLIAEVMINAADVGYTQPGDEVAIKVEAFPYQRHGLLAGRLRYVSEDSFSNQDVSTPGANPGGRPGAAFYRAQVELTRTQLEHLPQGARLMPGMTLNADITVGSRTILSYFLYPITRGFSESMREP